MAKRAKVTLPTDDQLDEAQGTLVPMSAEELESAGRESAIIRPAQSWLLRHGLLVQGEGRGHDAA